LTNPEVPEWAVRHVSEWADRLEMTGWRICLSASHCPGDTPDCDGYAHIQADINKADITLHAGLEDDEYGEQVIVHELLHVVHGRIDHYLQDALWPQLPDAACDLADNTYRQLSESYIHAMAVALVHMRRESQDATNN